MPRLPIGAANDNLRWLRRTYLLRLELCLVFLRKSVTMVLVAAAMAAPCIAKAGSTSGQCGAIKADAAKAQAEFEIIREAGRSSLPELCTIAHNIIHIEDHSIAIITHDPTRCGLTSDQIEYFEGSRAYWITRAVGCP
jgi:hypothetical protein